MSTRGLVGILNKDNSVTAIYNHFDSYFDALGHDLVRSFRTTDEVLKLLERGSGSYILDKEGYTDGETNYHYGTLSEFLDKCREDVFIEYCYIWKDDKWYGMDCYEPKELEILAEDGLPMSYERNKK